MLKRSPAFIECSSFLSSCGLQLVNCLPTYLNSSNPSLLDLALVRNQSFCLFFNQLTPPSFLDHDILFASVSFHPFSPYSEKISFRNFRNIKFEELAAECSELSWPPFAVHAQINDMVDALRDRVNSLCDSYAPLRSISSTNDSCPWFKNELKVSISEREVLFRRWKRTGSEDDRARFKTLRNRVALLLRKAKQDHYRVKLDCDLPPRQLWSRLKQLGICRRSNPVVDFDPDIVNEHFTSLPPRTSSASSYNLTRPSNPLPSDFHFTEVSDSQVTSAIFAVKSCAVGPDNIDPRFLKLVLPFALNSITLIFNQCINKSLFPDSWRHATVIPLPKKPLPKLLGDLRPISILPFLGKVLERLLVDQILTFSPVPRLLTPLQSGFRKFHSTETALIKVSSDICESLDANEVCFLVLLDFSKAFDSVDHSILLDKLTSSFGFAEPAINLLRSYLSDRSQSVKIGTVTSSSRRVPAGVPQGSILGPLLFSIFINDSTAVLQNVKFHLYADDIQLYTHCRPDELESCAARVNSDLSRIAEWADVNCLSLNPSKSCVLFVEGRRRISQGVVLPDLMLNGHVLRYDSVVRNLGVYMNGSFTPCDHVLHTLKKVYAALRLLRTSSSFIPLWLRRKLAVTLITPHFSFGMSIFLKLDYDCKRRLQVAFNDVLRYVWGLRRSDSVSHLVPAFLKLNVFDLIRKQALLLFFKVVIGLCPVYLSSAVHRLGTQRVKRFLIPRVRSSVGERSYFVQIIRSWNSLPPPVCNAASVNQFRSLLIDYLCDSASHVPELVREEI